MLNDRILPPVSTGHNFPALTQSMFIDRLPAEPLVGFAGRGTAGFFQVHQIDDDMLGAEMGLQFLAVDSASANNDDFRFLQHLLEIGGEQRSDVRDDFFDVLAVRTDQPAKRYIVIPDLQLAALSNEP